MKLFKKPSTEQEIKIIEFCYRWPDGRIEVRYRRVEGTEECNELMKEHDSLKQKLDKDCPYFWRYLELTKPIKV